MSTADASSPGSPPGRPGARRHRPLITVLGAAAVIVLVAVLIGGMLYFRGGIQDPAQRARQDAEDGYAELAPLLEAEEDARAEALAPVLGDPIARTWYIVCSAVGGDSLIPPRQVCRLDVLTTYAIGWDDPGPTVDELLTVLESTDSSTGNPSGIPWQRTPRASADPPTGGVAEMRPGGSVWVYAPDAEFIAMDPPVLGPFPDRAVRKHTIPASEPPAGHGTVDIRRSVQLSSTNVGCMPTARFTCDPVLEDAVLPRIEGFKE